MDNWYTTWQVVQARNADLIHSVRQSRLVQKQESRTRRAALLLALLGMR